MREFSLIPDSASTIASRVDLVTLFAIAIIVFFLSFIALNVLYFAVRYRRGNPADRENAPSHNDRLEMLWIVVPLIIAMVLFVWTSIVFFLQSDPPPDASTIYVVGKQWMWKVAHPEGKKEINELHVPLGRPVRLVLTSQDVIHDFYIPAFRVKVDAVPGRYTEMWFEATKVGTYRLFCAEYCGTYHSGMIGQVKVMDPVDYEAWLRENSADTGYVPMAAEGEKLFVQYHCAGCHRESQVVKAPRLEGVYGHTVPIQNGKEVGFVIADDRYIRDSILLPKSQVVAGYEPLMPSYNDQIPEEDLLKIIEYIKSIGAKGVTE
ncbi:MAG: cytochrome c oxidase subunit II [Isosphaeraceae bacterium]